MKGDFIGMRKLPVEQRRNMPVASVRLEKEEFSQLERAAKQRGLSRSQFLRSIVIDAIATQKKNVEGNNE